ncbi:family 78 glycoside hydrolase catalytic domain [Umezawaea tangerina]|uniref:alpha-L-rhamnosidase n=1 Tax=Umezawaea tangerina TaxID=84725 RepID=A0A2T0TH38_9PSEU|nr:family 78 glycoside hydrolase catalytic domain [Umezawaea tangerina]PRY45007.1 alpha-L-rhamnosidase [Umezawaea tangerina]
MTDPPTRLRLDHPARGSWWLPAGTVVQRAYEVRLLDADEVVWTSGRREGAGSVLVDLGVERRGCSWQVKVWTDLGESAWSEPAPWPVDALPAVLGTATWIEPHEPVVPAPGERPAYRLRHEFTLDRPVTAATAWVTAHGIYELFVNGTRVGDLELTPGFTAYRSRLQVQPHDVADLLHVGTNAVELLLSDGWFRGRHGFERTANGFGDRVAALLALEVVHDGGTTAVTTGPGWRSRPSRITAADLMDGQRVDLSAPEADWQPARPVDGGLYADRDRLVLSIAPPVRRIEELTPTALTLVAGGGVVVDFGQNVNGWVRLTDLGPAGTTLTLTHGEHVDVDGRVTTDHLRAFDFATGRLLPAGQVDEVVSAGRPGEVFEPRHTTHGFRYVQVDGHPGPLGATDVTAVVVHTDLAETGWFGCDDDRLNALHDAAVWSLRDNACDIPTDCPQRERSGFTGDWQVHVATAALTHDVAGFSDKWLRDLAADQWPDGRVTTVTPNPAGAGPSGRAFQDAMEGSAGWGDAAVLVPWELWRAYGDATLVDRQYDSMVRWVDYAATAAHDGRDPDRVGAPAPHERYLWDTGGHFGEWLEPGETPNPDPRVDHGIVATAYLARSAELLGRMSVLVGRSPDRYRELAAAVRDAWRREYLGPDGTIAVPSQANHVRALAFDLVPDDLRATVAKRLADSACQGLGTGFLSTGLLLPALADNGHLDVAYRVLMSTGVPSWLGMIAQGATTIWERWDGVDAAGARGSLNHCSKGAVISFLHTHIAGIRLPEDPGPDEAGYRRFVVAPQPGGGLRAAEAEHHSPYGPIRSAWRIGADGFRLAVDVPPGTRAEIRLPNGRVDEVRAGHHVVESSRVAR